MSILSFLSKRKSPHISRAESLNGRPVVAGGVFLETNDDGEQVLLVERKIADDSASWVKSLFGTKMVPRQIILDELGLFVFKQIDGRHSVRQIIASFAKEFKLHPREAEASIVEFLNMLMSRNVVSVIFERDPFEGKSS